MRAKVVLNRIDCVRELNVDSRDWMITGSSNTCISNVKETILSITVSSKQLE